MKRYDKEYFDRWYRRPGTRVITPADVRRKAQLAVGAAEYLLQREVRSVLDVGCGEGAWQPVLKKLRPKARYTGVDPSEYAVKRFGARRNIRLGAFGELDEAGLEGPYDLVVCVGVVNYLETRELRAGLQAIAAMCGGVALIEAFAKEDEIEGDTVQWKWRPAREWRRHFAEAGLVACGLHLYVPPAMQWNTVALERL
jgi:SAM-dependent methyltransferase